MSKQAEIIILPPSAETELDRRIKRVVNQENFEQEFKFFGELSDREQTALLEESRGLANAMKMGGLSDLAKGEHLLKIHSLLQPTGQFQKFVRKFTKYSMKQAYRYMNGYKNAGLRLAPMVREEASRRNMRIFGDDPSQPFGKYTHVIRQLTGPSKNDERVGPGPGASEETVNKWLDTILEMQKKKDSYRAKAKARNATTEGEPKELQRNTYHAFRSSLARLPYGVGSKRRMEWVLDTLSILANEAGIQSQMTISPTAIPEEFKPRPVGRPRTDAAANE